MKVKWNEKYTTIAIYSTMVICFSILFYKLVTDFSLFRLKLSDSIKIIYPFIIGFTMAYLFNFILRFYEKRILKTLNFKGERSKVKRLIGVGLTYTTVVIIIYLFSNFLIPQIALSLRGLVKNIPGYLEKAEDLIFEINSRFYIGEEYQEMINLKLNEGITYVINFATNLIPRFANLIMGILSSIWNIVLGLIISTYLLIDKEGFLRGSKRMVLALFSESGSGLIFELLNRTNNIFGKFLGGKILDSIIIGFLTFFVMKIFKIPYTILIAFIIGITNIIPFFGPFIGAIPSTIILLFESPIKAFWFLVIIIVIQQIDGNIIGPKILGDSLGISAFWILFALLVSGKIFGFVGLIIGVPLFALIHSIVSDFINYKLKKKNLIED